MAQGYTNGLPLDTDGTLSANSDSIVASQKAVKTYVDAHSGGGGGGTTTNPLFYAASGGASPGGSFNGSAGVTISYNSVGAQVESDRLTALDTLVYSSTAFIKLTGAGLSSFSLDTNTYLTTSSASSTYLTITNASTGYQPLDSDLTSWAGVTRATGFDTFTATPSSSNLASLITDETGSGSLVFATSPTLVTPVLGTPTSGTLTNCTGYTLSNLSGLGTNVSTFLATPSSANLAAAVTDETGTGALVFANSPALSGTPTAPTATANDNSTKLATTAYVDSAVSAGGGLTFNQVQRIAFLKI
jgi:hypothetical protein